MSARTPFVPYHGPRPASRVACLQDEPPNTTVNTQFTPDSSNPLHLNPAAQGPPKPTDMGSQSTKNGSAISTVDNGNKPFNTSSFKFSKTTRKSSMENPTPRTSTLGPASKASRDFPAPNRIQSPNIVAPIPRRSHARPSTPTLSGAPVSGIFAPNSVQDMFRLPALPAHQNIVEDQNAHISSLGFSFSKPLPVVSEEQQLPSPPESMRMSSTRVSDPNVSIELDGQTPRYAINMSLPHQTGPQRVLIQPNGTRGSPVDQSIESHDGRLIKKTNSTLKRPRAEPDGDTDLTDLQDAMKDNGAHLKRYRSREDGYSQRPSHFSSPRSSNSHSRGPTPDAVVQDSRFYQQHRRRSLTPPSNQRQREGYHNPLQSDSYMGDVPRPLDRLLGCNVDTYIDEHVEQYERALSRWKDCTMEEWVAGADEQAARFAKVLDFVKDHIVSKMALFANLDTKIEQHKAVLEERDKALEVVKARLVHESGNVLGTGCQ